MNRAKKVSRMWVNIRAEAIRAKARAKEARKEGQKKEAT